ncbi:MAG: tyrosine-type recombinase/integrase [Deltaproteobacteria bacterium]|nr:tyrosine-type recombinase/integrase [Deltaproteobacteria bacterium]
MIDAMPRKLPPFVCRERTRHGATTYYFRRGKARRIRLPVLGSGDFDEAYQAALSGVSATTRKPKIGVNSLEWLIAQYRQSAAYATLATATRRQRDNIFLHIIERSGRASYRAVTATVVDQGANDRKATPAQARNFLDALRGLFRWAKASELVEIDPTESVKNPKRCKGPGFKVWTDADVAAYECRWAAGTKERVWLHVLLYTGLRRGDAVRIGRQHVKDGIATIRQEKTGTEVNIPMPAELEATLSTGPTGDLAWICGTRGEPLKKESFGNVFKRACVAAGLTDKSAHGVRKNRATTAAEAGLSVAELESLFGWQGGTMASHYTRSANRKRLAVQGAEKIRNAQSPHLSAGAGTDTELVAKTAP